MHFFNMGKIGGETHKENPKSPAKKSGLFSSIKSLLYLLLINTGLIQGLASKPWPLYSPPIPMAAIKI